MEEEELTFKIPACIFEVFRVLGAGILEQVSLTKAHEAQLLNYLKAGGKRVGLLVNFAHPKAEIRRFVL